MILTGASFRYTRNLTICFIFTGLTCTSACKQTSYLLSSSSSCTAMACRNPLINSIIQVPFHHYLHNKCATKHHMISLRELFDYNCNCEFGRVESMPNACFYKYNDKLLDMFPFVVCSLVLVTYTAYSIVRICSTPYVSTRKLVFTKLIDM